MNDIEFKLAKYEGYGKKYGYGSSLEKSEKRRESHLDSFNELTKEK